VASRDRRGDVVWLYFAAPHKQLVMDYTVTSARTNSNVPSMGASLPFPCSQAIWAQQTKLDADLRISSSKCTPSFKHVHDYYPFALEDLGWLFPIAVDLVDRLATLVAYRRFPNMGAADSRALRTESYARMKEFVRRSTYVPLISLGRAS
jgi:hypothetical protein